MASIFTGLAFMHGHIVDRELVMQLGRDTSPDRGAGASAAPAPMKKRPPRPALRERHIESPAHVPCPTC